MTDQAAAPAPAGQQLPAAPALNTPAGMAARKGTHPAMRGQVQPGTQPVPAPLANEQPLVAPPPTAPADQVPLTPQVAAPAQPVQAPVVPDTNLLAPVSPPPLQYTEADVTPYEDPRLKAMQDRLDAQDAAARKAEADAVKARLLNPQIDYSAVGDIEADQAQAVQDKLVKPQLSALFEYFDGQLQAQQAAFDAQLEQFRGVGTQVAEVQHQQTVNQNTQMARLNADILAKHPTFVQDFNDPAFMAAAGTTYHNELAQAYHAGNAKQVIQVMDYVKGQMTQPVGAVEGTLNGSPTATMSPAPDAELNQVKQSDVRANVEAFQRKQISRADYVQRAAELEAARKAGLMVAD